jgi:hypothetical protein
MRTMTLIIELSDEQQTALAARAREQGVSAEQYALEVLEHDLDASAPRRRFLPIRSTGSD